MNRCSVLLCALLLASAVDADARRRWPSWDASLGTLVADAHLFEIDHRTMLACFDGDAECDVRRASATLILLAHTQPAVARSIAERIWADASADAMLRMLAAEVIVGSGTHSSAHVAAVGERILPWLLARHGDYSRLDFVTPPSGARMAYFCWIGAWVDPFVARGSPARDTLLARLETALAGVEDPQHQHCALRVAARLDEEARSDVRRAACDGLGRALTVRDDDGLQIALAELPEWYFDCAGDRRLSARLLRIASSADSVHRGAAGRLAVALGLTTHDTLARLAPLAPLENQGDALTDDSTRHADLLVQYLQQQSYSEWWLDLAEQMSNGQIVDYVSHLQDDRAFDADKRTALVAQVSHRGLSGLVATVPDGPDDWARTLLDAAPEPLGVMLASNLLQRRPHIVGIARRNAILEVVRKCGGDPSIAAVVIGNVQFACRGYGAAEDGPPTAPVSEALDDCVRGIGLQ